MNVTFDFTNKNCVVAGGASGMGRSIAEHLAQSGAAVYLVDINLQNARSVADALCAQGYRAYAFGMDATDINSTLETAAAVRAKAGRLDCLVNSIGIGAKAKDGEALHETFTRLIQVNLMGMFNSCSSFAEVMIETGGGSIVNIASMSASIVPAKTRPGRGGEYGLMGYCTAKGGVKMMTKSMALLWTEYGIRANSVSPGYVDTPLTAEPHSNPEIRAALEASVPIHRIAQADEIADTVLFLLSDNSGYITGQDVLIDGGFTSR